MIRTSATDWSAVRHSLSLDGDVVLVTGASSGIGAETCRVVAELGGTVVGQGRDSARLSGVIDSLAGNGHVGVVQSLSPESAGGLVEQACLRAGPLSGVVHAAGHHSLRPIAASRPDDYREMFDLNAAAAFEIVRVLRAPRLRGDSLSIALVGSTAAHVGEPAVSAYAASKGALESYCRAAAAELASLRIRVNCIVPGMVETPMTRRTLATLGDEAAEEIRKRHPWGLGTPAQVAWPIAFLLSPAASWISGSSIVVDGGYSN